MIQGLRPQAAIFALALFVAAVEAILGRPFIKASAPTYDEPVHLASGYVALTTTAAPLHDRDHGPMAEAWDALPLLFLKPALLSSDPSWGQLYDYGNAFLYKNRVAAETMLGWTRLWSLTSWTLLLSAASLSWSLRLGGWPAAAASAALLAFCPLWLSNAALVTTDAGSTALFFLTFWILSSPQRGRAHWIAGGVTAGLAMAAKYNMAVIPPLAAAAWLAELKISGGKRGWRGPLLMAAAAAAVITVCFLGRWGIFLRTLIFTLTLLGQGRRAFLCGLYSKTGWLWYFPFAFAVKTPIPFLVTAACGLASAARLVAARERAWLLLPPAFYFGAACFSKIQLGARHLLPVFPFLIVLGSCAAAAAWRGGRLGRAVVLSLGLWLAAGVTRCAPDYLAYFNEAAGGPEGGGRLLADSNLDWGQGLKELGQELRRRGGPPVFLSYFGVADPSYYGIRYVPVCVVSNVELTGPPGGPPRLGRGDPILMAVSQTNLRGVNFDPHDTFAWLESRAPAFSAGHSIFLYDLTGDADGRRRLAGLLASLGLAPWAQAVGGARRPP